MLSRAVRLSYLAGDAMSAKKVYWGIKNAEGDCIPDILSHIGEGDAWGAFWNRRYPDSRHYSLKEFAEMYVSKGYRAVKLEVKNGKRTIRTNRKAIR